MADIFGADGKFLPQMSHMSHILNGFDMTHL